MRTFKLTLAYDGTDYAGWQVQPDKRTLQGTLEEALATLTKGPVRTLASGRTDAGVHAAGQVVSARIETALSVEVIHRALNAMLPFDMAVLEAVEMPGSFHPIRDVVRKRYRYLIHDATVRSVFSRRYAWNYLRGRLDVEAMQRAAAALVGTHDFRSYASSGADRKTTVRTVYELSVRRLGTGQGSGATEQGRAGQGGDASLNAAPWAGLEDAVQVDVEGNGFLYNMVRTIVGTLVAVGRKTEAEDFPARVLARCDRRAAGITAPPQGLFLMRVDYGPSGHGRGGQGGAGETVIQGEGTFPDTRENSVSDSVSGDGQ